MCHLSCSGSSSPFAVLQPVIAAVSQRIPILQQRMGRRLVASVLLVGMAAVLSRPLLLMVFPGILLVHMSWWRQRYLSDFIPLIVGTSMAFWIVSFWFVPYLKLPLSGWAYVVILSSALLWGIGVWVRRERPLIMLDRHEALTLVLLLSAVALRLSFFWRWPLTPAGADMSMHSYLAGLIVATDGVPSSHRPLLPIDDFGAYPIGFQTLIALMTLMADLPVFRSALLMEVTTLSFLTLALYSFLRVFWDRQTSAMVALLVTFLPRNPQYFIGWGGDPTLLALAFLVLALGVVPSLSERTWLGTCGIGALITSASVFTHLIPVVGLLYAMIPALIYICLCSPLTQRAKIRRVVVNFLGCGMLCGVLAILYLPHLFSTGVSMAEIEWVKHFQRQAAGGAWGGTLANALITIPQYLTQKIFGWPFVILSLLGLLVLVCFWTPIGIPSMICALTVVGLVINSMYWVLPLSYALYPERVALLLILPFALGIAALLDRARQLFAQKDFMLWGVATLILLAAVRHNEQLLRHGLIANTLVTTADLQAMRWIQENTEASAVFQNRYGDAGLWIPAIAFRGITDPHLNPFYFDEFRAASSELNARYIYVGKKKLLGAPIAIEEFEAKPDLYRKAYDHAGVRIYEIITSATAPPTY